MILLYDRGGDLEHKDAINDLDFFRHCNGTSINNPRCAKQFKGICSVDRDRPLTQSQRLDREVRARIECPKNVLITKEEMV